MGIDIFDHFFLYFFPLFLRTFDYDYLLLGDRALAKITFIHNEL